MMCGRYTLTRQERAVEALQASLDARVAESESWKPRFNVAPTQPAPVVTLHDGARKIEMMRWGLVPFWAAKPGAKPPLMINARVESLHAKEFFREALARRRCLVPADGFFEWKRDGSKQPEPMYFRPDSNKVFAFAGLWTKSKTETGELLSFTIITGPPNELVAPIHDRMPIVLDPSTYAAWLDPTMDSDGARSLLGVPAVGDWSMHPVSTRVNKATNDDPACIESERRESAQRSLF